MNLRKAKHNNFHAKRSGKNTMQNNNSISNYNNHCQLDIIQN